MFMLRLTLTTTLGIFSFRYRNRLSDVMEMLEKLNVSEHSELSQDISTTESEEVDVKDDT